MKLLRPLLLACSLLFAATAHAEKVTVAAAADLKFAMDEIVTIFKQAHPADQVEVIYGSSGKFHTQISVGLKFIIN